MSSLHRASYSSASADHRVGLDDIWYGGLRRAVRFAAAQRTPLGCCIPPAPIPRIAFLVRYSPDTFARPLKSRLAAFVPTRAMQRFRAFAVGTRPAMSSNHATLGCEILLFFISSWSARVCLAPCRKASVAQSSLRADAVIRDMLRSRWSRGPMLHELSQSSI